MGIDTRSIGFLMMGVMLASILVYIISMLCISMFDMYDKKRAIIYCGLFMAAIIYAIVAARLAVC